MSDGNQEDDVRTIYSELNGSPFNPENPTDRAGAYLLSVLRAGDLRHDVASELGFSRDECAEFEANARRNRIFVGDKIHADWQDETEGGMAFLLDAMCVAGILERGSAQPPA